MVVENHFRPEVERVCSLPSITDMWQAGGSGRTEPRANGISRVCYKSLQYVVTHFNRVLPPQLYSLPKAHKTARPQRFRSVYIIRYSGARGSNVSTRGGRRLRRRPIHKFCRKTSLLNAEHI